MPELATVTVSSSRTIQGELRQPRALVKLNNVVVDGWISWEVTNNSFYEADVFRVSYAASNLPVANNASWFSTQKELFVEIFAGFPTDPSNPDISQLTSLIYGRVDHIDYNPAEAVIELTGRDLTAVFIDSKITDQYLNKTSSQIAQILVAKHAGMTATVTATQTKTGTYYDQDEMQLQASRSEWDLLNYLARKEAFIVYVSGQTLFFQPNPTDLNNPYDIVWQPPNEESGSPVSNALEMTFARDLTVGKGITVTARSPNLTTGKAVVQSYPSNPKAIGAGKASPFGNVQPFVFDMAAGHSAVEVQAYAKARYDAIVAHEMKLRLRLPADTVVSLLIPIRVTGTGTAWDQDYFPRSITREMSIDEGYLMSVEATNVNQDSNPES